MFFQLLKNLHSSYKYTALKRVHQDAIKNNSQHVLKLFKNNLR